MGTYSKRERWPDYNIGWEWQTTRRYCLYTNKEPFAKLSRYNFWNVHIGFVINVYIFRESPIIIKQSDKRSPIPFDQKVCLNSYPNEIQWRQGQSRTNLYILSLPPSLYQAIPIHYIFRAFISASLQLLTTEITDPYRPAPPLNKRIQQLQVFRNNI